MKEVKPALKIFCLTQPLLHTEWLSLLGDKYRHAFDFPIEFVENFKEADVFAWDGIIPHKARLLLGKIHGELLTGKTLILLGESRTSYKRGPKIEQLNLTGIKVHELGGWSVLPEELLSVLKNCYQDIHHV